MNKKRRQEISRIVTKVVEIVANAKEKLEELQSDIESIRDEESDCYENLPEGIMYSERGEAMEQAVDNLDNAASSIEELIDALDCEELIEYLNDAKE
jgi:K+/H+ antiporter YhaU regulatory subunit KhtT